MKAIKRWWHRTILGHQGAIWLDRDWTVLGHCGVCRGWKVTRVTKRQLHG